MTGMALAHCILGKFLGVVCNCFPRPLDVPTFAARCLYVRHYRHENYCLAIHYTFISLILCTYVIICKYSTFKSYYDLCFMCLRAEVILGGGYVRTFNLYPSNVELSWTALPFYKSQFRAQIDILLIEAYVGFSQYSTT